LKTLEKRNGKTIRNSREIEKAKAAQLAQLGPARPRARGSALPDRWVPPVSGGFFLTRSLSLPLSAQWGRVVGTGCPRSHAVFCICLAGPLRQHTELFPPCARSHSLRRGTALSASPSLRPAMDQNACTRAHTPRSLATSPAHGPPAPF
jgi:hypothetical protein